MNRVKAALVRKGLCSAEADDVQVNAIVAGFCAAKGVTVPASEDAVLAIVDPQPKAVDAHAVRAAERERISDLQARGKLLGISHADIATAINEGHDVRDALENWTATAAAKEPPVTKKITNGAQEADVFPAAAVEGLFARANPGNKELRKALKPEARDAGRMTMLEIGKHFLAQSGSRIDLHDPDAVASAMLNDGSHGGRQLAIRANTSGDGYQRPGDFPGILSALMGKMLDQAEELTEATYPGWTAQLESVSDFKPKTIHAIGEFGELPEHEDATPFDESSETEEASWIQIGEYADNWTLTPRMVINDDLGALGDVAEAKQGAHDLTMERICVNLLTGNAPAQDSVQLFDYATRVLTVNGASVNINDVASGSGGAPSTTQLALMRKMARKIYGLSLKQKLNQSIKKILVPEDLESVTEQLLLVGQGVGTAGAGTGNVFPATETATQIFRGRVQYQIVPMLAEASVLQWYAITTSPRTAIVTTHMKGYEQMRATSWFDPNTGCRKWNFMGRMAAAIRTWRTILRNAGQ